MKTLRTKQQQGLQGTLEVLGDKSISHRSIIFGAISSGDTEITHFLPSEDCLRTMQAFKDMGVSIERAKDHVLVHGVGLNGLRQPKHSLNMGNSGTTTRLMLGLLSGQPFTTELFGDQSLSRRPMKRVTEPLSQLGSRFKVTGDGRLPITVYGSTNLNPVDYRLPVASAQVKSALILAGLCANGTSTIIEKQQTRDHTELMLRAFGGEIEKQGLTLKVAGKPRLIGQLIRVPGDLSSAAFFIAAATLVPGSAITLHNVGLNPTRTGFLQTLRQMGANITVQSRSAYAEPSGDLLIQNAPLHAIVLTSDDIPSVIDELPLIALLATQAEGTTKITGAEELRVKETDRITVVAAELRKLGAEITELPDGMIIQGGTRLAPQETDQVDSHGDHRIGMMLAVAALLVTGNLALANESAINISYPDFFADLNQLIPTRRTAL
ncbi:3-phosphoshikimate 1-carboxyvinyltransferase [Sporolactobacillus shoreicorticis]|uniref:3-phosphoshikimate 1-carboxyvinyltransferase n=1 Tax=Sporolactobacillus shoreicorticis TaxID=1923877 RepID=A0ABW5S3A9_9BACL|nr:3-phosphoshikimate 1-carboxyvinyltransferase [Sporolactobacillus shoreicorticis]MCO7125858.1 3-phosphoshikimate 1-carboxyvinyltransferase [Sporolactobacillus shoreicorticis]